MVMCIYPFLVASGKWWIFMKLGMSVVPLNATLALYLSIMYH